MTRTADQFAAEFADFWRAPDPKRLPELLHDDVVLRQPMTRPVHGIEAAKAYFHRLVRLRPGVSGAVSRHAHVATDLGDYLYVDWTLRLPLRGAVRDLPAIDRFLLVDGRAKERLAFIDVIPHIGPMLLGTAIWNWPAMLH
jgi:ketosteroid isomerase-like protein